VVEAATLERRERMDERLLTFFRPPFFHSG